MPSLPLSARTRHILAIVCVLAGVAMTAVPVFPFGVGGFDEGYQYQSIRYWQHAPFAILTFWIGHVWTCLFGDTVLALRWLNCITLTFTVALGAFYFFRVTRRRLTAAFVFLLGMVAMQLSSFNFYGWDNGAFPFIVATCITLLSYWRAPTLWKIVLLGSLTAIMGLSRIPTLSALPLIAVVIFCRHRKCLRQAMRDALLGLCVFAVVFTLITTFLVGSPATYIRLFFNPDYIITNHSGYTFIHNNYGTLVSYSTWLLPEYAPCIYAAIIAVYLKNIRRHRIIIGIILVTLLLLSARSAAKLMFMEREIIPGPLYGLATPLLYFTLLIPFGYSLLERRVERFAVAPMWIVAGFIVVGALGSDMAYLRLNSPLYLFPLAATAIYPSLNRTSRRFTLRFWGLSFLTLGFAWYTYFSFQYRANQFNCTDIPELRGIRMEKVPLLRLARVKGAVDSVRTAGLSYEIIGNSNDYKYLFHNPPSAALHHFHWAQDNIEQNTTLVRRIMEQRDAIFVINLNEIFGMHTEEFFARHGYRTVHMDPVYALYIRTPKAE